MPLFRAPRKHNARKHRPQEHREQQGPGKRKSDGPGHRLEQTAFDTLQREDREIGRDNDGDRIEHRALHFVRRSFDPLRDGLAGMHARMRKQAHDVFDHYYGAFHDHAEIKRTQREQVGGNVPRFQTNGGK